MAADFRQSTVYIFSPSGKSVGGRQPLPHRLAPSVRFPVILARLEAIRLRFLYYTTYTVLASPSRSDSAIPLFVWLKYYAYRIPSEHIKGKHSYVTPPENLVRGPRELTGARNSEGLACACPVSELGSLALMVLSRLQGYGPSCARYNNIQATRCVRPRERIKGVGEGESGPDGEERDVGETAGEMTSRDEWASTDRVKSPIWEIGTGTSENDIWQQSFQMRERKRLMELLKRFEEQRTKTHCSILKKKKKKKKKISLSGWIRSILNEIDNVSHEQLWEVLTPAECRKFLGALNDSWSDIAQFLLTSEDLEGQIIQPWWDAPPQDEVLQGNTLLKCYGHRPQILALPEAVLGAARTASTAGPSLLFNIFAVLKSRHTYSILVHHSFPINSTVSSLSPEDPEFLEAKRVFSTLVPFLTDRKSTVNGASKPKRAYYRPLVQNTMTPAFFALLMRDAAKLLQPATVVALSNPAGQQLDEHPSANALLALSDISTVSQLSASRKSSTNTTVAKLTFYAARVVSTPSSMPVFSALSSEAVARAKLVEREGESAQITWWRCREGRAR
ncbi:hypothetical protein BC629DRAFT_1628089 [Irpex lacteus]|nr:hypothetical protein BC629DRAFT_1628089 [Irpex lacteus]